MNKQEKKQLELMKLASKVVLKEDVKLLKALHKADMNASKTNHSPENDSFVSQNISVIGKPLDTKLTREEELKKELSWVKDYMPNEQFEDLMFQIMFNIETEKAGRASAIKEFKKYIRKQGIEMKDSWVISKRLFEEIEKELGGTQ